MSETAWRDLNYHRIEEWPTSKSTQVDDVHLVQPIGFVWFRKPRYRVKAATRRVEE